MHIRIKEEGKYFQAMITLLTKLFGSFLIKGKRLFKEGMFATSPVRRLGQTKDERRKRNNQQIGTEMPGMFNVRQIQHDDEEKYNVQCQTNTTW